MTVTINKQPSIELALERAFADNPRIQISNICGHTVIKGETTHERFVFRLQEDNVIYVPATAECMFNNLALDTLENMDEHFTIIII